MPPVSNPGRSRQRLTRGQASAIALKRITKAAPYVSSRPVIDRPFEDARWNGAINYPFKHWMKTRYSDGTFGVWYGADSIATSIHETVHHWRFGLLRDAGFSQSGIVIERKIYDVRCDATLIDLRKKIAEFPGLISPDDYSLTQQAGARLHREGHPGLVTKSARSATGDVMAILNPKVLSDPRLSCFLSYRTTDTGVDVERVLGTLLMRL